MAQKTDEQLQTSINGSIKTNGNNEITGAILNGVLVDINDSKVSVVDSETIAGVKTFSSFPITPSSAPTTNYQTANKKYVDDSVYGLTTDHGSLSGLSDDDHPQYAQKVNVLELDNTTAFTPDADYEPATKKYVDDNITTSGKAFSQTANKMVVNTLAETTLFGTGVGSLVIPANTLVAGSVIRCILRGEYSNEMVGNGGFTFNVYLNSTRYVSVSGEMTSSTGWAFEISFDIQIRTSGATGTAIIAGYGTIEIRSSVSIHQVSLTDKTVRTIDTTENQELDLTVQLDTADLAFGLTSISSVVEILK